MLRLLKRFWWMAVFATGATTAFGFVLHGPINEPFQVPDIGYNIGDDNGAPKNLGEEYRWNKPTLYYAFDQNFLDYFGSNGVVAVEQALAIYNALTNVSLYSSDLSEFPLETRRFNYRAQAMQLLDMKSTTMNLLAEQLGLGQPDRFTWCLHDRWVGPGGCPGDVSYLVIKRNFEPVFSTLDQYQASSYVNGTLYSYQIIEICSGAVPLADAYEFAVDPLANTYTAIASRGIDYGSFYTGLTRDDVAGLRYMLRTNNMNWENAGLGTAMAVTNLNSSQLLVTSNLTVLLAQALTNDPAALTALYPGLVIANTTFIFTNLVTTNATAYFTNYPWSPAGSPPTLVFATNYTTNVATWYNHSFVNVVTNSYFTNGILRLQTTTVGPCQYGPPGLICTNVTTQIVASNLIVGDYFLLPTNSDCGVSIVRTQLVTTFTLTNDIITATNATTVTNQPGTTNVVVQQFFQSELTYFTNHIYVINPVPCVSNALALRQGIEKIRFVRRDFDSLIGKFFEPITDEYTVGVVTNNTLFHYPIRRLVTQPDILFSADDLTAGPNDPPAAPIASRSIRFDEDNILPRLFGPGTIEPDVLFTFNKVGPLFFNYSPTLLDELSQQRLFTWAMYDGTTNAPVVFPNGASFLNLENQVLILVNPSTPQTNGVVYLPAGTTAVNYTNFFGGFTVLGGQAPYAWALSPGSPGLPFGLALVPDVENSARCRVVGTPNMVGTYDFGIRLTEAGGRYVDRNYSITINP
jgi:hypothetical protein